MGTANGRKSIFITGAASGMGRETARLFREKGWFIGGYDVNADGLRALEKELGADNCVVRSSTSPTKPTTKRRSRSSVLPPAASWTSCITTPVLASAASSTSSRSRTSCASCA